MKIEFFPDGSEDCPLVLLYGRDIESVKVLRQELQRLVENKRDDVAIHELPGFSSIDNCQLYAKLAKRDMGVRRVGSDNIFECTLQGLWWENVIGLLEPFCYPHKSMGGKYSWQYLDETSDISLLISTDRSW